MVKVIQIITKGATEQISTVASDAGQTGNILIIKAQKGIKYELRDVSTHFAPNQLLLVRKGKDLLIRIDTKEDASDKAASPDIVIENYYGYGDYSGNLVGMSEDGQYYNYAPQEGTSDLFSVNMDNSDTSYQSLGYSDVTTETNWLPYVLALGALIDIIHQHNHDNGSATPNAPDMTAATDTGASHTDNYTGDNTPDFAISAPANGETPKLYIDGVLVDSTFDPINNILTPVNPIPDGPHTVTITETDSNGNESPQSPELDIVIDTTPPALTAELDPASDSGIVGDGITNDTTPTISGTGEVGAAISVVINGQTLTTTVVGGVWSVTPTTPLGDGSYTAAVTETDLAGNTTTADVPVTIDTTPPTTTVDIDSITVDSGTIGDFKTNDNDGLTVGAILSASLAPDEKLLYSNDNGATWIDITSSVSGTVVSYADIALVSTATVKMKVVDAAGNDGAVDTQLIIIDVLGPATTISINGITNDSGTVGDFITNDNDGLIIDATLSAGLASGEKLMYSTNGGVTWTDISSSVVGTAISYADASLTSTSIVQMKVVDAADNDGAVASQLVTIDTTTPTTTIDITSIADDSGTVGDFITNDHNGLIINATLSAPLIYGSTDDEKLYYSTDGGATWIDITSSVTGVNVSYFDASLTSTKTVEMKVVCLAGNDGALSSQLVTIDTTAPTTTVIIDGIMDDSGTVGDFTTNDNNGILVDGLLSDNLAEGEKLYYSNDNGATWIDITADSVTGINVSYFDATLTSTSTVKMKVVDAAGNDGVADTKLITIDTTPPTTTVNINSINVDSGTVGDFITNDNDGLTVGATLSTSLVSGEKLYYSTDGVTWIDITGSVTGTTVSYTDLTLTTTKTVQMKVVDAADNSGAVDSQLVTIDIIAPTTTVDINNITVDSGVAGDFITNDNDGLTIGATLSAGLASGEKLMYRTNEGTWIDISSSVTGTAVSYADASLTATDIVQMKVVDAAGNDGVVDAQLVTIDTTAPTTTVIIDGITDDSGTYGDFTTNDNNGLLVDGTLSDNLASDERLYYSTDGITWIDITSSVSGINVSYFDATLTTTKTVQMKVIDAADNSGAVASQLITIDTAPPTTTVNINSITVDSGTVGDFTTNDNDGLTVGATLSTSLASGEKLLYSTDGVTWIDITSSVSGTTVSYADPLLTSTTTVQMKVVDAAGNDGPVDSQLVTITVTGPATTIDIDSITDDSGTVGDFITNDNNGLTVGATLSAGLASGEKLYYSTDGGATWIDITSSVVGTAVSYADASLTSTSIVQMKVVDAAGNDGVVDAQLVTIDTTAPTTTVDINYIADDSGVVGDFITNDNNGLTVGATLSTSLVSGEKLYYSNDNGATWIDITSSATVTTVNYFDASLTSTSTVKMKVVDAADNDGAVDTQLITIDTTPPTTTVNINSINADSGTVGDFITSDNDGLTVGATLSASLVSGEKLYYSTDGVTWIDITGSVSGTTVSYTDLTLTTTKTVQMKVVDAADNSGAVDSQLVTIDIIAPTTTVDINNITVDSGVVGDFTTNDNNGLTVGATLSAGLASGEKLYYSTDGGATWIDITSSVVGTAVSYADASLTSTSIVQMKVVDAAGNDGVVDAQLVTIDTTAPTTTVDINYIADDSGVVGDFITNDNNGLTVGATLSTSLVSGEKLYYSNDNGATWIDITSSATVTTVNYFDATLTSTSTVKMKVVDSADNDGTVDTQLITIDTTPPTTTVNITSINVDSGTVGDFITNDNNG
ncbi:MAG: Ig-like domain-containing protein [Sulfurovaceae bacterium]|nr:Ig-like domain-containing protein [Sulfurovaceae bacterium]